jgi:hypothetical protein
MRKRRFLLALFVAGLMLSVSVPAVRAQENSGSGQVMLVPRPAQSTTMPDGRVLQIVGVDGFVTGDQADNPFAPATQSCAGTVVVAADGSGAEAHGYCDGVDTEGDVWWIWWSETPAGGKWGIIGGTGKFTGMEGGGTTNRVAEWPDGRYIVRWEGTWSKN